MNDDVDNYVVNYIVNDESCSHIQYNSADKNNDDFVEVGGNKMA